MMLFSPPLHPSLGGDVVVVLVVVVCCCSCAAAAAAKLRVFVASAGSCPREEVGAIADFLRLSQLFL